MEKTAISVSSSSPCGGLFFRPGWHPFMVAPTVINSATSATASEISSSHFRAIAGLVISKGEREGAADGRLNCSSFNGLSVKSGRRFDGCKARGNGVGAGNYSFHKGILQPVRCHKMFVPGFGEKSPEAKAADSLHNFFTFVAVKIVLSQLQDYNREGYEDLMDFVDRVSLKDGDKFCAALMRESFRHKGLGSNPKCCTFACNPLTWPAALRIMEVRSAYSGTDFEWDNLKKLCDKHMEEANIRLMREFLVETSEYQE